jgi:hypothetical protein
MGTATFRRLGTKCLEEYLEVGRFRKLYRSNLDCQNCILRLVLQRYETEEKLGVRRVWPDGKCLEQLVGKTLNEITSKETS